jgi:large subunit ribosomal protein L5
MAEAKKADKSQAAKGPQGAKAPPGQKPKGGKGGKGAPTPAGPEGGARRARVTGDVPPRLRDRYRTAVIPALMKERGYTNPFQVPRLEKIVINMGVGEGKENAKVLDFATADLEAITGQKPVVTRAKKSIANFKLRENAPIGCKVTLRGARMYEFLDRLVNVALPRVRDFKGVPPKAFDGRGNCAVGLKEQVIFPEIVYDKVDKVRGMDVVMVTSARTDEEAKALLTHLGVPFRESLAWPRPR